MIEEIVWHPDILNAKLTYHRVDLLYKHIYESKKLAIHPYKKDGDNVIKIESANYGKATLHPSNTIYTNQEVYIKAFVSKLKKECGLDKIEVEVDFYKSWVLIKNFTEEDAEKAALILRMKGE